MRCDLHLESLTFAQFKERDPEAAARSLATSPTGEPPYATMAVRGTFAGTGRDKIKVCEALFRALHMSDGDVVDMVTMKMLGQLEEPQQHGTNTSISAPRDSKLAELMKRMAGDEQ